jgi:hypothetical protein
MTLAAPQPGRKPAARAPAQARDMTGNLISARPSRHQMTRDQHESEERGSTISAA